MRVEEEYLKVIIKRFQSVKELGDKTIGQLTDEQIHWVLNEASNSIAVIVKHLNGNMLSRWTDFLTSDGEKPARNRDQEFEDTIRSVQELKSLWENGWNVLFQALHELNGNDLLQTILIRSEKHTVIDAIERQLAHYAYHIGQIVYIGKLIKGKDWETLSIPKGQSEAYLEQMQRKYN
ncbi:DUF1572 family protein [Oceanobacillus jeddahense]|uniref:DUF1572 domain-containing protein n=1 Tax=Oceanobacillus jeddahense TaxID=1462527 RepID=A0ABY5JWW5_9BACI|nr:DUF1572 family protein [Oceanobacillus jeddahense]UUI03653.1 DUF1572 domain-containing protein [Oceanobacillus jeddahense]